MTSVAYRRYPICVYLVLMMLLACVTLPFSGGTGHAASRTGGPADWPMYGYDPAHSNFNVNEHLLSPDNVGQLTLKWKFPTNGDGYDTTPAVIDGTVYVSSGALYALNATNGAAKWWRVVQGNGTPTTYKDTLYANVAGLGCLSSFDKNNGTLTWSFCGATSSPVIVNDTLYLTNQNQLVALDASTGILKWNFVMSNSAFIPSYVDGIIYVASGSIVYALDAITGKLLWGTSMRGYAVSSFAIEKGVLYVGANDNKLYAINAKTGIVRWAYDIRQNVRTAPAVANGVVYLVAGYTLFAIDAASGEFKWSYNATGIIQSSPVVANGVVYFTADDGQLYALNAMIGTYLRSDAIDNTTNRGQPGNSSPVVANGVVYILSGNMLYAWGLPGL